jgi:hypothetical protein
MRHTVDRAYTAGSAVVVDRSAPSHCLGVRFAHRIDRRKPMTRARSFTLGSAATALCILAHLFLCPGRSGAADLITLSPSTKIVIKGPVPFTIHKQGLQPPASTPTAFASVILLTGGDGVLALDAQGRVTKQGGNFLTRSAYRFMNNGVNVAILDAPGSLNGKRLSESHARYVASAILATRKLWPKTGIWLVGTSNGAVSAFNLAARTAANAVPPTLPFPDRPDGVVLASPIVQGGSETVLGTTPPYMTAQLKIPVAVVSHTSDPCPASDSTLASDFATALLSPRKKFYPVTGAMPAAAQAPCDAFSYHWFHGIEDAVVQIIVDFIK